MQEESPRKYVNNTPFEWGVFIVALIIIIANLYYTKDNSINYLLSALLYVVTGVGMMSKTLRARGIVSYKVYRIWLVCIALVFLAAALTIITESRNWNLLWLAAILAFGIVGRKTK